MAIFQSPKNIFQRPKFAENPWNSAERAIFAKFQAPKFKFQRPKNAIPYPRPFHTPTRLPPSFVGPGVSKVIAFFCQGSTAGKEFLEEISVQGNICQTHPFGKPPFCEPPTSRKLATNQSKATHACTHTYTHTPSKTPCKGATLSQFFVNIWGLCGVSRANRFARFARIGWLERIGNSSDSGESATRYKHRVSVAND